jgi:hypothetical protein
MKHNWGKHNKVVTKVTMHSAPFNDVDVHVDWCTGMNIPFFTDFHTDENQEYDYSLIDFFFANESDAVLFTLKFSDS